MLVAVPRASAQGADPSDPAPSASVIDIEVETFGVGGIIRPGEPAGVRLYLTDTVGTQPRAVAVRLHVPDADGDTMLVQRDVVLQPGVRMLTWLYPPMPWNVPQYFTVTVHDLPDSGRTVGRQLAAARISPMGLADTDVDMIGVVGTRVFGLDQYELGMAPDARYESQEWFEVVSGLAPEDLPDRWEGLEQYDVLVWGDADPTRLGLERPRAIEEWVRRGNHLVIVVPSVASVWFTRDDPLRDIMPDARLVRVEDVSYEPYRNLLTTDNFDHVPMPQDAIVHSFERDQGVDPMDAAPIIDGPHGVVVTRRLVGAGMVTVVGLDLADPRLRERRIIRADTFWHRVLGKSFPIPFVKPGQPRIRQPKPPEEHLDRHFAGAIENTAQAGVGILLAVVVFAAYWLVAGPLGFGVLKMNHWHRHAWVAFIGTIGVFALIAWAGANTLSETTVRAKHLTFLTQVYGQSYQTTTTYAGVMVPGYGDRSISVRDGGVDADSRNLVSVWSDPLGLSGARFPDARSYPYNMRDVDTLTAPVRSTVKTVRAEWAGGVRWRTPRPQSPDAEPRLEQTNTLSGSLVHDLPGALEGVRIVLVYGQRGKDARPLESGANVGMRYPRARVWNLSGPWQPGTPLDLLAVTTDRNNRPDSLDTLARELTPGAGNRYQSGPGGFTREPYNQAKARTDADRLSFRSILSQPRYNNGTYAHERLKTFAGHGLDLGRFFTMPCVIITGHVTDTEDPTPLRIGGPEGEPIESEGHTVVRWIYPLTPDPVSYD